MSPRDVRVQQDGGAPVLAAESVAVTIDSKRIVESADIEVNAGELVVLVGPNGAGKSTFVRALAGIQKYSGGSVRCKGVEVSFLGGRTLALMRAFVPQRPRVPEGIRVREAMEIGRSPQLGVLAVQTKADREAIDEALGVAGIDRFADRFLTTLSGGELQRVQIAIGLAQGAPLLIADEPTSQLDLGATVGVAKLLRGLTARGYSVLLVVHDLALASAIADRVVVMADGRTVASGPPSQVLTPDLLASVWDVEANLEPDGSGSTALRVSWLGSRTPPPPPPPPEVVDD